MTSFMKDPFKLLLKTMHIFDEYFKLNRGDIFVWQISYPPVNGASQSNYFLPKSHKLALKKAFKNSSVAAKCANFFSNCFWFWLDERSIHFAKDVLNFLAHSCPEIIGVKVYLRGTDRQML